MHMKNESNEPKLVACYTCEREFNWTRKGYYEVEPEYCDPCYRTQLQNKYQDAIVKVRERILKITPTRFKETDSKHDDFNVKLWQHVQPWKPTKIIPWLGLIGATGLSKTRCAYLLLTELAVNRIKHPKELRENIQLPQIEVINACQFMDLVTAIYSEDRHKKHNANDVLNRIRHANVLLIDDLGKQRNTPAVSSELFTLLNYRHEENLTTVWTANINPEEIVSGMTSDFAAPLAGRLRECSHIINVTEPKL